ncbi:MAG: hypothetical protein KBS51_05745 [Lachnospiraceae bacterium]|nr:hypothetical protein [Candidatus Darwinimomas equi]
MDEKKMMEMSADEFREALEDLRKTNQEQADYAKRTWIMSIISTIAVLIVAVFIIVYGLILMPQVNSLLKEAEVSLNNIEKITDDLSKVDIEGLMNDVSELVTTTEADLGKTMEKIDELNIEELNRAITNLSNVIEPLAEFFGVLGDKADDLSKIDVGQNIEKRVDGIEGNIEKRVDGIGGSIEKSVGNIGKSIGDGIEKGLSDGVQKAIGGSTDKKSGTVGNKKTVKPKK